MRTAREVAHAATGCGYPAIGYGLRAGHSPPCDGATAAIEARDAEHAAAEANRRELAVESDRASIAALRDARAERDRLLEAVRVAREALEEQIRRWKQGAGRHCGFCDHPICVPDCPIAIAERALIRLTPTGAAPTDGGAR